MIPSFVQDIVFGVFVFLSLLGDAFFLCFSHVGASEFAISREYGASQTLHSPPSPHSLSRTHFHHPMNPSTRIICKKPPHWDSVKSLHLACKGGFMDDVLEFISSDPTQVHQPDFYGNTPLYYTCLCGHLDICNLLLEKGCRDLDKRGYLAALTEEIRALLYKFHMVEWRKIEDEDDEDAWHEPTAAGIWSDFTECMVAQDDLALNTFEKQDLKRKLQGLTSWVEIECGVDGGVVGCFWNVLFFHWDWLMMYFMVQSEWMASSGGASAQKAENAADDADSPSIQHHDKDPVAATTPSTSSAPTEEEFVDWRRLIPPPEFSLDKIHHLTQQFKSLDASSPVNIPQLMASYKTRITCLPHRIIITDISTSTLSSIIPYLTINRLPHINLAAEENYEQIDSLLYAAYSFGMTPLLARILRPISSKVDSVQLSTWKYYSSLKEAQDIVHQLTTASKAQLSKTVQSLVSGRPILSADYFKNLCFVESPNMFSVKDARETRREIVLFLLCDTKLTGAGSSGVYCHQSVIIEKSPFFRSCLEGGFSESFKGGEDGRIVTIPFPEVPDAIVHQVGSWLFTNSRYSFSPENAVESLMVADRLQLSLLHQKAVVYLLKIEGESNPEGLLELAYLVNNSDFKRQVEQHLIKATKAKHYARILRLLMPRLTSQQLSGVRDMCRSSKDLCINDDSQPPATLCCPECDAHIPTYWLHRTFPCCDQRIHDSCFDKEYHGDGSICPACLLNAWIDKEMANFQPDLDDL